MVKFTEDLEPGGWGAKTMKAKILVATTGLALAVAASAPAEAQFMSSPYPVIIVPPPPAQNLIMPKYPSKPAQPAKPAPPPEAPPPDLEQVLPGQGEGLLGDAQK